MKTAIVCDWLIGGGAEKVVLELHHMHPEAPIYTSYATDEWRKKLDGKVVTGYLQHFPRLRKYVPFLRAVWFSRLNLNSYDLVISSSGAEAKGIKVSKPAIHINYCHAPTHYYWDRYDEYIRKPGSPLGLNWLARLSLKLLVGPMRRWDYKAAGRPDFILANSTYTQAKIKEYYGRDSVVIHPPVDTEHFAHTASNKRSDFVTAGRQTPYKRTDLAVAACTQLKLPLTVIGNGPDHSNLVKLAGSTISFIPDATDQQIAEYFASAQAFIFPNADDFGIIAVEAMAAGTPVIAYKDGGALDYVIDGKTGIFFDQQTPESLAQALQNFKPEAFDSDYIRSHAQTFSREVFRQKITDFIQSVAAAN